jgi:5-methylcytosine-specific restriction enzyme subunit McrC
MYAYGKKYNAQKLFLIYPANENFMQPLQIFDYEEGMSLQILPFELSNDTNQEILKIIGLLHEDNIRV